MRKTRLAIIATTATLVGLPLAVGPAVADDHSGHELTAELTQLNDSGASGTAWAMVDGTQVEIKLETQGLLAGAPHAQHIHIGGQNVCPSNDQEGSGFEGALQVSDAADQYGAVAVSLTNEPGKTGPDAALDVENFPADASNTYSRTITVSEEVAQQIAAGDGVVVVHGVDHDGSGTYDGDTKSDLDPSLPSEATDPAACGELNVAQMSMPEGGVETGGASTAGIEYPAAFALGTLAMGLGAFGLIAARRRATK
ncbi:CHRD domain-containing protein [Myceligenerans xiligouense]|uniref:CHRD domain-containing protein n=1 Tax=Myceligenerans xiligouense TaxID=253184 RepID=A0A3N4ZFT4_9MICO|nr:CHRD domain-containing protein [Myceligenerans xiligouense]RPF19665.1 CHRD domain-containing protein [Myceligenerans xiligouense]